MSALLGRITFDSVNPAPLGWQTALDNLRSRSGPREFVAAGNPVSAVMLGRDPAAFFESPALVVMLDGNVDIEGSGDPSASAAAGLAEAYLRYGSAVASHCRGSFAAVIVDRTARTVLLFTDVLGTRPLYYARTAAGWYWASELKGLAPLMDSRRVNPDALSEIFHYRWTLGDQSLLHGATPLLPSHAVTLGADGSCHSERHTRVAFEPSPDGSMEEAVDGLDTAFDAAYTRLRARYDSIAVLLSGGVDSALLAAKARQHGFRDIFAVTARFPGFDNPEEPRARRVAERLGLRFRVLDVTPEIVRSFFPDFVWRLEQPPRHYSQLAFAQMFAAVAPEAPAVISGVAADVLFGSGDLLKIRRFMQKHDRLRPIPGPLRKGLGRILAGKPGASGRIGALLGTSPEDFCFRVDEIENITPACDLVPGVSPAAAPNPRLWREFGSFGNSAELRYQNLDFYTMTRSHVTDYLRLAEPQGVTVEMPFMAPEVIQAGTTLSQALKSDERGSKPVIKRLACRYLPSEWIYDRKLGFPTPFQAWLQGPLASRLAMLTEPRTLDRGIFRADVVRRLRPETDPELTWTALTLELACRQLVDGEYEQELARAAS